MTERTMDLGNVLNKVHKLIAVAEHDGTPVDEAQAARLMADKLMLDYAIEQAMLDSTRPVSERTKPGTVEVPLVPDPELMGYVEYLVKQVALHCSCRVRSYSNYNYEEHVWYAKVYGFESDLRYFEILYTTLRLHMVGALRPGIDYSASIETNSYALHAAGYNWYDIAKLFGWREDKSGPGEPRLMYHNVNTDERRGWSTAIAQYKRAYMREVARRGEQPLHVSPSGVKTFQRSAAEGYAYRIAQRLREVRERNPISNALVQRVSDVDKLFRDDNPDLFRPAPTDGKVGRLRKYVPPKFNEAGYQAGVKHANTASFDPATGGNSKKELD